MKAKLDALSLCPRPIGLPSRTPRLKNTCVPAVQPAMRLNIAILLLAIMAILAAQPADAWWYRYHYWYRGRKLVMIDEGRRA